MSIVVKELKKISTHFKVLEFKDSEVGLTGFVAIHNTNLGPALGGTRVYDYTNKKNALMDALSLSKAMTYKCSIAGLPFGGGKAVIIGDPKKIINNDLLKSYAEIIKKLGGLFFTGEDVGLNEAHVQYMLKFCPYFIGKSEFAGDPSPFAALSTFVCIKEALKIKFGSKKIKNRTFAIKGIGKTGSSLINLILKEGGKIIAVADINKERLNKFKISHPGIKIVSTDRISKLKVDVFSPCAVGNDITKNNLPFIKAKIIAGTANNQLSSKDISKELFKNKILHIPDYISNSGGLINVANELLPGKFNTKKVLIDINKIPKILHNVLIKSKKENINPDTIADLMAENIFNKNIY